MVKLENLELDNIVVEEDLRKTLGEEQSFEEFTDSIGKHGALQPVLVEPAGEECYYSLLIGGRRLKAAGKAGLKTVPAVILDEAEAYAALREMGVRVSVIARKSRQTQTLRF